MKKALLIGINYIGTSSQLRGCINDVKNMNDFLIRRWGFLPENITIMSDETTKKPIRINILSELQKLILSDATSLFFHYSGHGGSVKDTSGDEEDGRDETIIPLDYLTKGQIIDDEIRGLLTSIRSEQKMVSVFDCCHSGTGMDLRYNLYERVAGSGYTLLPDSHYKDTRGQVILFSGCLDPQTSADAYINSISQGAMTRAFLDCFATSKGYFELIKKIRKYMIDNRYSQIPNLSCGQPLGSSDIFGTEFF